MHNRYGPAVRTSSNELSYIQPAQFKEIYGHKASGQQEFAKDKKYHSGLAGPPIIINADREEHAYVRKLLANGFSDKALREQEAVMQEYVETLMQRLREACQDGQPVEISAWYNVCRDQNADDMVNSHLYSISLSTLSVCFVRFRSLQV